MDVQEKQLPVYGEFVSVPDDIAVLQLGERACIDTINSGPSEEGNQTESGPPGKLTSEYHLDVPVSLN